MKTPEQLAAETAEKINLFYLASKGVWPEVRDHILAALTEYAKGLAYGNGQHDLVCEDLGCSADPNAPGPSAHEAVQDVVAERDQLRARVAELEDKQ